jgi:hypothetical protein
VSPNVSDQPSRLELMPTLGESIGTDLDRATDGLVAVDDNLAVLDPARFDVKRLTTERCEYASLFASQRRPVGVLVALEEKSWYRWIWDAVTSCGRPIALRHRRGRCGCWWWRWRSLSHGASNTMVAPKRDRRRCPPKTRGSGTNVPCRLTGFQEPFADPVPAPRCVPEHALSSHTLTWPRSIPTFFPFSPPRPE